jgi:hypothetical protein
MSDSAPCGAQPTRRMAADDESGISQLIDVETSRSHFTIAVTCRPVNGGEYVAHYWSAPSRFVRSQPPLFTGSAIHRSRASAVSRALAEIDMLDGPIVDATLSLSLHGDRALAPAGQGGTSAAKGG